MENEPKPQKRGRKPKTVKDPITTENVIIEDKHEPDPPVFIDEIPEANEETAINEFIEEINNEIENPSEEMKDVIEEILRTGDTITNFVGDPNQIICLKEEDIFEVSTTHFDSDSYRVGKGDSQCI